MQLGRTQSAGNEQPDSRRQAGRVSQETVARGAAGFGVAARYSVALAVGLGLLGCGNTYRPVVAAINPIGPAAQPQKYALAVSSPAQTSPGQNCPATPSSGLVTIVDFSGDTVLITASLSASPYYFQVNASGSTGFTLNCDNTLNSFDISTSLISSNVLFTTLLPGADPVSILPLTTATYIADPGLNAVDQLTGAPPALKQELPVGTNPVYVTGISGAARLYALTQGARGSAGTVSAIEATDNAISATLPVGRGPVYGVMTSDTRRAFILNQTDGTVSVINVQNNTLDQFPLSFNITGFSIVGNVVTFTAANSLAVGASVTIAGLSTGTYLNGQTLTVLATGLSSTQFEASFTHGNVGPTSDSGVATATALTSTIPVGVSPLWADFAPTRNEMVVANEGTGTSAGSVSILSIPLCSAMALPTNPNCDANNPVDATGFGQTVATVPVGVNPIMVSVLSDGSRAYVANAGTGLLPCSTTPVSGKSEACTVSVVNLTSNTVTATIPVTGHPVYLATTDATPTGKVYVVAKDSTLMTVIETDTDTVDTTIPLQGYGVSVRVTAP